MPGAIRAAWSVRRLDAGWHSQRQHVYPSSHFSQPQRSRCDTLRPSLILGNEIDHDVLIGDTGETAPQISCAQGAADAFPRQPHQGRKLYHRFSARCAIHNPVSHLLDDQIFYADRLQATVIPGLRMPEVNHHPEPV